MKVEDLKNEQQHFTLSARDIRLLNPNTRTCPIFRSKRDMLITKAIYEQVPVLIKEGPVEENPWNVSFNRMFDMSNDSHLFRTREQLENEGWRLAGNIFQRRNEQYLPLYEGKMISHFDHRFGTYDNATQKFNDFTNEQHWHGTCFPVRALDEDRSREIQPCVLVYRLCPLKAFKDVLGFLHREGPIGPGGEKQCV